MGYLFFQTFIWLIIAAAIGLLVGWLIWGRGEQESDSQEVEQLRKQLKACQERCNALESAPAPAPAAGSGEAPASGGGGSEPSFLASPKGSPDDLKRISGVGPVLEKTLNDLGIFHFWQIAEFTQETIDWVDDYLSFPGRIQREDWVGQANKLAAGEETEFSSRYEG